MAPAPVAEAMQTMLDHSSMHDGGQLAFMLQTEDGSALFSGSSGYWPGIFSGLRPDVAFLALAPAQRIRRALPGVLGPVHARAGGDAEPGQGLLLPP